MEVQGLGSVGGSLPVNYTRAAPQVEQPAASKVLAPQDEVEISSMSKMLDDASRTSGLREQRLAQIKAAIDAGTYDTPEKLELALSRMFEQVSREIDS